MTADRLWRCPRCHAERRQPDFVTGVGHTCQPPGRPAKWVDWRLVEGDERD